MQIFSTDGVGIVWSDLRTAGANHLLFHGKKEREPGVLGDLIHFEFK